MSASRTTFAATQLMVCTSNSIQDGFRGAGVPLLAAWTGEDVSRGPTFNQLNYLQRDGWISKRLFDGHKTLLAPAELKLVLLGLDLKILSQLLQIRIRNHDQSHSYKGLYRGKWL